jgi:ubiquinone/menaquinone biosynthesis C-methylase UbiE
MKDFWEERFEQNEYIYGKHPNELVKEQLQLMKPGKGLFPAEGEGRNAVYAAKLGWECHCYDYSRMAREKALKLAEENKLRIRYEVADLETLELPENTYDAAFITFLHLAPEIRSDIHQKLMRALKKGGILVMEAFDKQQLPLNTGGPKNSDMLYTAEMLAEDFSGHKILQNKPGLRLLEEGRHHDGRAFTIRLAVRKE